MATFVIGDIHGNRDALNNLLVQLRLEVTERDTVVFLGDYIDRGPDTKGCIDLILDFKRGAAAETITLLGNHEDWLLHTMRDYSRHSWLFGTAAFATIRSYSPEAEQLLRDALAAGGPELFLRKTTLPYEAFFDRVPAEHVAFFEGLKLYHETPDCVCVHAGLDSGTVRLADQPRHVLIWGLADFPGAYTGDAVVVYGHWDDATLSEDGTLRLARHGNAVGIDTIAHGVLTAIRVPDQHVFHSTE